MSSLQRFTANYLNFTNKEKAGIFGLLLLIGIVRFLPDFLVRHKDYSQEIMQFQNEIAALQVQDSTKAHSSLQEVETLNKQEFKPFYFDPNTVDPVRLSGFGLNSKLIERFAKFRNAGAKFYKKEDVKKIYGLRQDLYDRMEPYIVIETVQTGNFAERSSPLSKEIPQKRETVVELNTADSLDLIAIKGIGPYLSSKILRYRKALGGYVSFDQLFEIYGVKAEQIEPLRTHLIIGRQNLKTIPINDADFETLNAHPYLNGKEAMAIIKYRKQHGAFRNRTDLEKIILISKETLIKLEPYLVF